MVDSTAIRAPEVSRLEFEALRTRSNRMLIAAVAAAVVAGFVVRSSLENAESTARMAQTTAANAINEANAASTRAHQAAHDARQALLHAGSTNGTSLPVVPKFQPVVRPGQVTAVTGTAPANLDDTCVVTVVSRDGGENLNCQTTVRCGDTTIYGGGSIGYLVCGIKDGQPAFGVDHETRGDPMLELNLAGNTVVVSDGPEPKYSVTIALEKV